MGRFFISSGFTLIELIVAISVIAILSTAGIASFVTFSQRQALATATFDVVTMLNTAKSRALSQVKPSTPPGNGCITNALNGYVVNIDILGGTTYTLLARCLGAPDTLVQTGKLPIGIAFGPSTTTFFFQVQTGHVVSTGTQIRINGYSSQSKTITVTSDARIQVN